MDVSDDELVAIRSFFMAYSPVPGGFARTATFTELLDLPVKLAESWAIIQQEMRLPVTNPDAQRSKSG